MSGVDDLIEGVVGGNPRALARALTVVENDPRGAEEVIGRLPAGKDRSRTIGITGGFGAGKSTLIEALGSHLVACGARVGVLAIDPTSPFSGGALLGDRVRMTKLAAAGAFVRSMATRGVLGGLSAAASDAIRILEAAGFDWIIVETVGVGQDEIDIASEVDSVVVLLPPGAGDEVQTAKAGLLEIADIFVVNKADQPGADALVSALEAMLSQVPDVVWQVPVLQAVARRGEGIEALVGAIERHRDYLVSSGRREALLAERRRKRVLRLFGEMALHAARTDAAPLWDDVLDAAGRGAIDSYGAARKLLEALTGRTR